MLEDFDQTREARYDKVIKDVPSGPPHVLFHPVRGCPVATRRVQPLGLLQVTYGKREGTTAMPLVQILRSTCLMAMLFRLGLARPEDPAQP